VAPPEVSKQLVLLWGLLLLLRLLLSVLALEPKLSTCCQQCVQELALQQYRDQQQVQQNTRDDLEQHRH
jgi:hypothetical protein